MRDGMSVAPPEARGDKSKDLQKEHKAIHQDDLKGQVEFLIKNHERNPGYADAHMLRLLGVAEKRMHQEMTRQTELAKKAGDSKLLTFCYKAYRSMGDRYNSKVGFADFLVKSLEKEGIFDGSPEANEMKERMLKRTERIQDTRPDERGNLRTRREHYLRVATAQEAAVQASARAVQDSIEAIKLIQDQFGYVMEEEQEPVN